MNQDRASIITNSQLKDGYKQTEVGIIPEDWDVATAVQICEIIIDCKNRTPPVIEGGEFAVVRTPNVRNGRFVYDDLRFTDESSFREWTARAIPQIGDILITREAPLGEVCLIPKELKVCLGQRMMLYRPDRSKIDSAFFLYSLMAPIVQKCLLKKIGGSTVGHAKVDDIRNVSIPLPPTKEEQEAIASTLSDIDALIESLDRLLTKKRQIKQGAMQELLRSKDGWVLKRLGEICEIGMGRTPPRLNGAFWGKGYKWLSIADLKSKVVNESKEEITTLAAADMKIIPKGTLLMSFKLSLGRLCFAGCDLFTNEAICSFNQLQANAEFLYYVLGRTDFSLYGKQAVKGYTLNKESLNLIEVKLPSIPEQIEISNILSDMDAEIGSIESKLTKTRQLKQGMMHELLTGRIRLVDT
jgi:type I restriction enzyme, S subunit